MSDHLPECPCNNADERGCFLISAETDRCVACICPALRACEARLEDEWLNRYNAAEQRGYDAGFRNGVLAACDAASNQRSKFKARDWDDAIDAALAAIDALRGES